MTIYLDSSFLVSLYGSDANLGPAVETLQNSTGDFLITPLSQLEVVNAFALQVFRKHVSAEEAERSLRDFEEDLTVGVFQPRPLPEQSFDRARQLSRQTTRELGTRTADLLHVAAALEMGAEFLYSFDKRQRSLAHAVQLKLN